MTMQIGVRAKDSSIALVSDTKARFRAPAWYGDKPNAPLGIVNHSKIVLAKRHDLAVAFAGYSASGMSGAEELANHLSAFDVLPDEFGRTLTAWGNDFFSRHPGQEKSQYPVFSALVVNPKPKYDACFWRLDVMRESTEHASSSYMVNGLGTNAAMFWMEYCRADKTNDITLNAATGVAAATIMMAGELDPHSIGGLEIFQYQGRWERVKPHPINKIEARFRRFERQAKKSVFAMASNSGPKISRSAPKTS